MLLKMARKFQPYSQMPAKQGMELEPGIVGIGQIVQLDLAAGNYFHS
jgi:hypothetical protein